MGVLGGFASAIVLAMIALLMAGESVHRMFVPAAIHFNQAILVAVVGLVVNLVCALIFKDAHHHHHHGHDHGHHSHEHGHGHEHHHDLNLRAAYLHVLADALTSVTAIVALLAGKYFGWSWLDPLMGIVGAVLVAVWAKGLVADTGKVLLDREMDHPVVDEIREVVQSDGHAGDTRITDLHVWRVGKQVYSCAMTVVTHDDSLTPEVVRERLSVHEEIVHSTIEIHLCPDADGRRAFAQ